MATRNTAGDTTGVPGRGQANGGDRAVARNALELGARSLRAQLPGPLGEKPVDRNEQAGGGTRTFGEIEETRAKVARLGGRAFAASAIGRVEDAAGLSTGIGDRVAPADSEVEDLIGAGRGLVEGIALPTSTGEESAATGMELSDLDVDPECPGDVLRGANDLHWSLTEGRRRLVAERPFGFRPRGPYNETEPEKGGERESEMGGETESVRGNQLAKMLRERLPKSDEKTQQNNGNGDQGTEQN